jgi:cobalt transporter subunit CbtB
MTRTLKTKATATLGVDASRVMASAFAIMLGLFIFFGAGFAPMAQLHNATHDVRHSFAMPCH